MKLISCYIENFGGLSRYALEFTDGVTVLEAPNGFGKTTLAEFLRAMFYGFPRKAKTLDKSRRQKYTPWNGGKFGGNLVFEFEGKRYRLERTFGATPRSDTFQLLDLTTNRKSDRFSEEIGQEIFRLDADSFERSTYLPQNQEGVSLTTAGIQAKLADLVENTNDLGNFDKAMGSLRTARSAFIPYRGNGGSVAEAASRVTQLQQELDRTNACKDHLDRSREELERLNEQSREKESLLEGVRQDISAAAQVQVSREKRKQLHGLLRQQEEVTASLLQLAQRYPEGIPSQQQIGKAREWADELATLSAPREITPWEQEAVQVLARHGDRFAAGLPEDGQLQQATRQWETYRMLVSQQESGKLTDGEQQRHRLLGRIFASGELDENRLDELAEQNRQLLISRAELATLAVSREDRQQMSLLNEFFARGVPEEAELEQHAWALDRRMALEQENTLLTADMTDGRKMHLLMLIPALVMLAAGLVLMVLQWFVPGGILLGAGILAGVLSLTGRKKTREAAARKEKILANTEEMEAIRTAVEAFTKRYLPGEPSDALEQIRCHRETYLVLLEKLRLLKEKQWQQEAVVAREEASLRQVLEPLLGQVTDFDKAISQLRVAREQYLELDRKVETAKREETERIRRMTEQERAIGSFLSRYGADSAPAEYGAAIAGLRRDAENYLRAREQAVHCEEQERLRAEQRNRCMEALDAFFSRFSLQRQEDVRSQLQQLRDDGKMLEEQNARKEQLEQQIVRMREEDPRLAEEETEITWDAEQLKLQEKQLTAQIAALGKAMLQQEQNLQTIRNQLERLPEVQDELEFWQNKRRSDQDKARILDDTMTFLQNARESLTTSYLGPIRKSFSCYLEKLTQLEGETVFISPELEVQLERLGQARELGYFSAGQTDVVMLCMRFALVDALFGEEETFVILDDPFVNLDDRRTAEALKLLKELGRERQILYLTCNSSRSM